VTLVPALLAGLAAAAAYWLAGCGRPVRRARPPAEGRRRRQGRDWFRPAGGVCPGTDEADATALAQRLAALARVGVSATGSWQVLAAAGEVRGPAEVVAAMLRAGGSVASGLRLAASREPSARRGRARWPPGRSVGVPAGAPLAWLAVAYDVLERSGAPVAGVLDRFAEAVRDEAEYEQRRAVALAGPRATAAVLSALPLAAPVLAMLSGGNPLRVLVGSGAGRVCLTCGAGLWLTGRWWAGRLVASAARAGR
jgi:tight adherence protein B